MTKKTLREANPIAADMMEYDDIYNDRFVPEVLLEDSKKNGWFRCFSGNHLFICEIAKISKSGSPYYYCEECQRTLKPEEIKLPKTLVPDSLPAEWSLENEFEPELYTEKSRYNAKWICRNCGKTYSQRINKMIEKGGDCPYCNNRELLEGVNSIADRYPQLVRFWPDNIGIKPSEVLFTVVSPLIWKCDVCGSEYDETIENMARYNGNCPYCNGRKLKKGMNSISDIYPELLVYWADENGISPDDVLYTSNQYYYWQCQVCKGVSRATIDKRISKDYSCPYCSHRKLLEGFNSISDIYPEIVEYWSDKNDSSPDKVICSSYFLYYWKCLDCGGVDKTTIEKRISSNYKCPYCSHRKLLKGFNSVSDMYPEIVEYWSNQNEFSPDKVICSSDYPYYWKCPNCGGIDRTTIEKRISSNYECPYCTDRKYLKGLNSLREKNSILLEEWDYRNNYLLGNPKEVFYKSDDVYWWICSECGYHYSMSPNRRSYFLYRSQKSCPHCKGRRRNKIFFF